MTAPTVTPEVGRVWADNQLALNIDRATMNLLALLGPAFGPSALVDTVTDEVERRARLFADLRATSPRAGQHPRLAALQSVTADVIAGRFA